MTPNIIEGLAHGRVETILAKLFGIGVDSSTRLFHALVLTHGQPAEVFWRVLLDAYPSCDDTWSLRRDLAAHLVLHGPGIQFMGEEDRAFYDGLPARVALYRGCSRRRQRGCSWTTDKTVAEGFARGHRSIPVPDPVLAEVEVVKTDIYAVFSGRRESEVLLNPGCLPKRIRHHSVHR